MSIDEPTFTYAGATLTDDQKKALDTAREEAKHAPPALRAASAALEDMETLQRRAQEAAIRARLGESAREHVWDHKTPMGALQGAGVLPMRNTRVFTREEVLTVLRTLNALNMSVAAAINAFSQME